MFVRVKKDKKSSSRATTSYRRSSGKHSSSEPSTPSPRLPAQTYSTDAILQDLRALSFHPAESAIAQQSSGRVTSNPIPIPLRVKYRRLTLSSTPTPSYLQNELKLGDAACIGSPFASNTTDAASLNGDDDSTLAVHNSSSPKHSPSPDGTQFDYEEGNAGISNEILTSDDEIETIHGSTKRPASRSIFSSSPSPEPAVVRSLPISIPIPSLKRSRSQQ